MDIICEDCQKLAEWNKIFYPENQDEKCEKCQENLQ
jgi:hypothetical protein